MSTPIPQLEHGSGSWVVTSPCGVRAELYSPVNAQRCADMGWRVESAGQYLGRINSEIRSAEKRGAQ